MRETPDVVRNRPLGLVATLLLLVTIAAWPAAAQESPLGSVAGAVLDPLGARVGGATVTLLHEGKAAGEASTDEKGQFSFPGVGTGRYQLAVKAAGFEPQTARSFFVGAGARVVIDVPLHIGLKQDVVVTASATEQPASQVGAPVTVIERQTLDDLAKPTVLEALRLVPGSQVVQVGGRGGATSGARSR